MREREGIEGFEENGSDAKVGKAALIDSLDLGGEEEDGDVGDGGDCLHEAEGAGPIDAGHHDIHEDGVWMLRGGDGYAFGTGACGENLPAGGGLEGECGDLTDVVFVIDDEDASHERAHSLTQAGCGGSASGDRGGSEIGDRAQAMDHGDDEFFYFFRLHLCLGEELGGAEPQLAHLVIGDLATGVDDERQGAEAGLLAKPLDEGEAIAVREG